MLVDSVASCCGVGGIGNIRLASTAKASERANDSDGVDGKRAAAECDDHTRSPE
jgi:hypothetical protein